MPTARRSGQRLTSGLELTRSARVRLEFGCSHDVSGHGLNLPVHAWSAGRLTRLTRAGCRSRRRRCAHRRLRRISAQLRALTQHAAQRLDGSGRVATGDLVIGTAGAERSVPGSLGGVLAAIPACRERARELVEILVGLLGHPPISQKHRSSWCFSEPKPRVELGTYALRVRCSTN